MHTEPTSAAEGPTPPPIFFVHVMKTGGMTLLAHLRRNLTAGQIYPDPSIDLAPDAGQRVAFRQFTMQHLRSIPEHRRNQIRVFSGHLPLVARDVLGLDVQVMTILRHPVDRTVSLLRQLQRPASWIADGHDAPLAGQPLEAVYEQPHVFEPLVHDHQTKMFSMTLADRPTGFMQVIDVDRSRLDRAKAELAAAEVLGLTERYQELLDEVSERFGWRLKRDAWVNAAPPDDARASKALQRRIAEDNALDMELYEHAVDLIDDRRRR